MISLINVVYCDPPLVTACLLYVDIQEGRRQTDTVLTGSGLGGKHQLGLSRRQGLSKLIQEETGTKKDSQGEQHTLTGHDNTVNGPGLVSC